MRFARRLPAVGIVLFWGVMTFLLLQREGYTKPASLEGFREVFRDAPLPPDLHLGVYLHGKRTGSAETKYERLAEGAMICRGRFEGRLEFARMLAPIRVESIVRIDSQGRLSGLDLKLHFDGTLILDARGVPEGNILKIEDRARIAVGGRPRFVEIPLDQGMLFSSLLNPLGQNPRPVPGKRWSLQGVNPVTLLPFSFVAEVQNEEEIELGGRTVRAFRVQFRDERGRTYPLVSWLDSGGRLLRQEIRSFGIRFDREEAP